MYLNQKGFTLGGDIRIASAFRILFVPSPGEDVDSLGAFEYPDAEETWAARLDACGIILTVSYDVVCLL